MTITPCPRFLKKEARTEWKRIAPRLANIGILTEIDRAALAGYCQAYGRWVEAEKKVLEKGEVVKSVNGNIMQNPYLIIANKSMDHMRKFLVEFGMTPSSRSRITADKKSAAGEYDDL